MSDALRIIVHADYGPATLTTSSHFSVFFIKVGTATLVINGESLQLDPGMGTLIRSGQCYLIQHMEEEASLLEIEINPYELFNEELAKQFVTPFIDSGRNYFVLTTRERMHVAILKTIEKTTRLLLTDSPFAIFDATLQCAVIWRYWIQQVPSANAVGTPGLVPMNVMLTYIEDHIYEKVTLAQIADAGSVSRSECCRLFSALGKTSPLAYVQARKMEQAAVLLKETKEPVGDLAKRFGFSSVSHFVQAFKTYHAVTPLAYRKQRIT